jgi:hypothetical protein
MSFKREVLSVNKAWVIQLSINGEKNTAEWKRRISNA